MPYPLPSPEPRQAPYLRLVPSSEMDDGRGTHRADDEDPPTVDPTAEILKTCGAMAVAVYHVARCNLENGTPNKYEVLAEQCGVSLSTMHRIVRPMIGHGFIEVQTAGGGRGKQTVLSPVNRVINHVTGDTVSPETVSKTVSKTVSAPPTPPVVVDVVQETTSPLPPKPTNGAMPTYRAVLGQTWPVVVQQYRQLDPELNEPWLAKLLCDLEPEIGPLTEEELRTALGLGWNAVKRKLTAERNGKDQIRSVRGLSRTIIVERLTEVRHG